ncbi:hypothetical protein F2P81_004561 [Scophthalmus maximus]|uniref:Testis-expressed sequence 9 protein n=1 Tax=Scophthalmus maximus TaxID=52904 RepID=A0A6A4TJ45_SCOMX|nr:hypothetical protein F2P81_004561 [Scophthalmus maximus]
MLTGRQQQQQQQQRAVLLLLLPAGPPPPTSLAPGPDTWWIEEPVQRNSTGSPSHTRGLIVIKSNTLSCLVVWTKKRQSSSAKAEGSKMAELRPPAKSASGLRKNHTDDLLAKEEQYKHGMFWLQREQSDVLSKPLSSLLLSDNEDEEDSRTMKPRQSTVQGADVKMVSKKLKSTSQNMCTGSKTASSKASHADKSAEDSADFFLAKAIHSMAEKMSDTVIQDNVTDDHDVSNAGDNVGSGISDVHMRVFNAKLRIMQEELDQLSCEYYKKDDENAKLSAKIKELEEDRARLQRTTSIQQTQIEKHRALAEESAKKSDGLQLQVSGLLKEIENLNRSNKQAAAAHGTVEVRLNRAQEEVERLKTQLGKMKQMSKDKTSEEHQSKENLLAENKMLKRQKAELIVGFKKQLKLIDILKKQKMHFEAAKLLSFKEDEFMKALDWGKS